MPDPNYIRIKRSNTATNVPSSLESGELAANVVDQKLWIGASNTTPVLISDILGTFTNKGSWDYYSAYQINNVVEYAGVFYFAKSSVPPYNTQPNINTTYWSPFSNPSGGGITLNDISSTMTGLDYNNTTGVFSATSGYSIPQTSAQTNWDSAYTERLQWDGGSTNLVAATGRTSLGATTVGSSLFTLTDPAAITFPRFNADNTVSALDAATFRTAIGAGTGTVTSVGLSLPSIFSVSSPVTGSGTLSGTFISQSSFTVFAGPSTSKTTGAPTFRYLTALDIPILNQNTTGTASNVTGTVAIANGGTGQTTANAAFNALTPMTTLGDIIYHNGSYAVRLAGNTTTAKQFLTQTGTGSASAAPAWASLSSADVTTALGFTPASPGGNSGEFQYKNASGGFSGTSALQFQATAFEDIRVYGTSTSRVPFSIYVPSSTSYNYFEINNVNSINYVTIDNFGNLNLFQGNLNTYNNVVFTNSNTNRTITLARPSTFAASYTLTLPTSAGTNGQVLLSGGGASPLQWGNSVSNLNGGDGFTLKGSIPYQSDVNTTTLLSPNTTTTRKFLRQTGTGTNGAAPAWDTLTSSDITTALGYTPASGSGSTAAAANLYLANNFGGF